METTLPTVSGAKISCMAGMAMTKSFTTADRERSTGPGDDLLGGLGGDDTMYGEEGDDTIKGHCGDDGIDRGPGTDTIDGGTEKNGTPGNDTCSDPDSGSYTNCEIEDGVTV